MFILVNTSIMNLSCTNYAKLIKIVEIAQLMAFVKKANL